MKIGIYGDSFAEYNPLAPNNHWGCFLKELTGAKISYYAKSATPIVYSYKKFIESHKDNDVIIFLVTDPFRYTKPIHIVDKEIYVSYISTVEYCKEQYRDKLSISDKSILDDINGWFRASDNDFLNLTAELMLLHMESMHSNIIFFPCFLDSIIDERYKKYGIPKDNKLNKKLTISEFDLDNNLYFLMTFFNSSVGRSL